MGRSPVRKIAYCVTVNNWSEEEYDALKALDYKYLIIGKEIGENGTPHLQVYIHFKRSTAPARIKKAVPRAHIEVAKGSAIQNKEYCSKEDNYEEFGEIPVSKQEGSKIAWATILEKAEQGKHDWIKSNYPKVWVQLSHRLESLQRPKTQVLDGELLHEWWIGPTGTGKSKTLWECYPDHFQKDTNKWWCGYTHQNVVAIEEWSPKNECTGSFLKIWADRYPFTGQIKGGSLQKIRPIKIVVLSNYEIDDCFPDNRDASPLKRRFTVLRFPQDISKAKASAASFHFAHAEPADEESSSNAPTVESLEETELANLDSITWSTPPADELTEMANIAIASPNHSVAIGYALPWDQFGSNSPPLW